MYQITSRTDLHRTENGDVDVSAANHAKALDAVEDRSTRDECDSLLPSVDEIAATENQFWGASEVRRAHASTASSVG